MASVLLDILRDDVDEIRKEDAREYVSNLVKDTGMSVERAMEALGIPEDMRADVAASVRAYGH